VPATAGGGGDGVAVGKVERNDEDHRTWEGGAEQQGSPDS